MLFCSIGCSRISFFRFAVRKLSSYNLSGWTHAGSQRDAKSRWLHGALQQGPVLLQETRWTDCQPRDLMQSIPGVHVIASSAQISARAVVLPSGWRVLNKHVVLEGRIVAAHLSLRGGEVWLISVYLHPDELAPGCRALHRFLSTLDGGSHFLIGGDFNRAWDAAATAWEDLVDSLDLQLIHPPVTFSGPSGDASLDGYLVPGRFVHQAGFTCKVFATWPHDRFGHAALRLSVAPPPRVRDNPAHPKHQVIPTSALLFPPGDSPDSAQLRTLLDVAVLQRDPDSHPLTTMREDV